MLPNEKKYIEEGHKLRYLIVKKPQRNPDDNVKININHWGKKYEIYLKSTDKILEIKLKLFPFYISVKPRNQRLIYNSIQLEEEKTLEYYKIKNNANISLVERLKGY